MKQILKYIIWLGIYAVLIVPFIVANNMFFPYITGKAFTFRIIAEIIFALWLVLIMKDKEFRLKWSWVLGSVGIFTFILLIADINAVAPYKAFWSNYERMEGWVTFIHLFAYFLVLSSMFNKEKSWLWFLRANIFAGFIMAVTSIASGAKENIVRIAGPLGNPIYISVYFLFIFFFGLILLYKDVLAKNLSDWKAFRKVFLCILFYIYIIVSVLSLYVVYRTSRGAFLGAIGGIFIGALCIAIFERNSLSQEEGSGNKVIKQIAISGVVIVVIVVGVFMSIRKTDFVQNDPTLSRFAEISWANVNGQARQLVWPMALKGFKEKPILGWGQEGFNYVFNKYYDSGMYGQETWFDRAHNAPLDFLVACGILGFLSYLSLFGLALFLLWFKKNNLSVTEKGLLTGLLGGYLFQAIFVFDNLISYIMFFSTLAYIHSRLIEKEQNIKNGQKPILKDQKISILFLIFQNEEYQNYIFIPVVVIFTVFNIWWVNIPSLNANQALIRSIRLIQNSRFSDGLDTIKLSLSYHSLGDSEIREQLLSYTPSILKTEGVDNNIKQDFLTLTFNELEKQINRVPEDARYYILLGSLLNNIGASDKALFYIQKAIELSPRKQAMRFELIKALYTLGRKEEALAEAKSAYELDTRYEQAREIYETLQKEI